MSQCLFFRLVQIEVGIDFHVIGVVTCRCYCYGSILFIYIIRYNITAILDSEVRFCHDDVVYRLGLTVQQDTG